MTDNKYADDSDILLYVCRQDTLEDIRVLRDPMLILRVNGIKEARRRVSTISGGVSSRRRREILECRAHGALFGCHLLDRGKAQCHAIARRVADSVQKMRIIDRIDDYVVKAKRRADSFEVGELGRLVNTKRLHGILGKGSQGRLGLSCSLLGNKSSLLVVNMLEFGLFLSKQLNLLFVCRALDELRFDKGSSFLRRRIAPNLTEKT